MNARGTGSRYLLVAAICALAVMGSVGCSSSKSSKDSQTSGTASSSSSSARTDVGTSEADLKTAAAANATAKLNDSNSSYDYLAASCKQKYSATAWDDNLNQVASILKQAMPKIANAKVGVVNVRNVTPVAGEAQVTVVAADGSDVIGVSKATWDKWIVENGMWVTTTCAAANDVLSGG